MGLNGSEGQEHRYQLCKDEDCERFPCRVYKEGYRNGYEDGWREGYAAGFGAGYAAGYSAGYSAGAASCG